MRHVFRKFLHIQLVFAWICIRVSSRSHFGMTSAIVNFRVQTMSGDQLSFEDNESGTTVWRLKGLIKERLGVPRRLQKLFDGKHELANCETLACVDNVLTIVLMYSSMCRICNQCCRRFCSGCFSACYCSEECQLKDWAMHRHHCGTRESQPGYKIHH